ncbi:hypothetical protein CJJ19_00715 [Candidatus Williamhamiltonella defendens]|nr:hypothetical protein CJJ19_00715 [Candidatus Hamiltonella defensa]
MQETTALAERLKNQIAQENETIQNLTRQQLNDLRNALKVILQQELNTIKTDIRNQNESMGWKVFRSRILWPLIIGLSLSLGIFSGSWLTMSYYGEQIIQMQGSAKKLDREGAKIQFSQCGENRTLCIRINKKKGVFGKKSDWMIPEGY